MVLHYHNVKDQPLFEYQRIARFMGLPLTNVHVSEVLNMTTVEAMQQLEKHKELPHSNAAGTDRAKVRSGTSEAWREEIAGDALVTVNQLMSKYMPASLVADFFNEGDYASLEKPLAKLSPDDDKKRDNKTRERKRRRKSRQGKG